MLLLRRVLSQKRVELVDVEALPGEAVDEDGDFVEFGEACYPVAEGSEVGEELRDLEGAKIGAQQVQAIFVDFNTLHFRPVHGNLFAGIIVGLDFSVGYFYTPGYPA